MHGLYSKLTKQLTPKKGSAYNENNIGFQTVSSSDKETRTFTINSYISSLEPWAILWPLSIIW